MPIEIKRVYLNEIRLRYRNALKKEKTKILDEFTAVCHYERKYAIRILNGDVQPRSARPGPKPVYDGEVVSALKELWGLMGMMCSKKMKAAMPLWLPFYSASERIKKLLLKISPATIDRLLQAHRAPLSKGLSTTRPNARLKAKIPIKVLDHVITMPGFIESDTVAHCGNTTAGEYANSLTMTDLFSGWTENRAVWTKTAEGVLEKIKSVEKRLPFTLVGFASDNGSEFINEAVYAHLRNRDVPVNFVRRRAYKKNDNAHVEQKNWTHVRQLFGYERFDQAELVPMMNEIYQAYWNPLWNLFTPVMKLVKKERVGGRIKKYYDTPKTPYERLLESSYVSYAEKARLKDYARGKNPIYLRRELDEKLKTFFNRVDEIKREQRKTGA